MTSTTKFGNGVARGFMLPVVMVTRRSRKQVRGKEAVCDTAERLHKWRKLEALLLELEQRERELREDLVDNIRAAHARELLQARLASVEKCIEILWERTGREEYGHAKAAVTLDIAALEDFKTDLERQLAALPERKRISFKETK